MNNYTIIYIYLKYNELHNKISHDQTNYYQYFTDKKYYKLKIQIYHMIIRIS